jgi:hypothetical protein
MFLLPAGRTGHVLAALQGWAESDFSSQWCFENYVQLRSMKRARDIREQLTNLMERVEIELASDSENYGAPGLLLLLLLGLGLPHLWGLSVEGIAAQVFAMW